MQSNPLLSTDFGLASVVNSQGLALSPDLVGQTSFTFSNGNVAAFAGDDFSLTGGCPAIRDYDAASSSGSSVVTHRYASGVTGPGATIMNNNSVLRWNTIWMGFGWFDLVEAAGTDPSSGTGTPDARLARKILDAVLPLGCVQDENPTGVPDPETEAVPAIAGKNGIIHLHRSK